MPSGRGYTVTYDGVASTDLTGFMCHEVTRQLVATRRTGFEDVPGMEGAYLFPEEPGMRSIEIDASVMVNAVDASLRRDALRKVAAWVNKSEMKKLLISDEPGKYDMAIFSGSADPREWRQRGAFTLPFLCEPYSYQEELQHLTAVAATASVDVVVPNDGTVWAPFIVQLTANANSATQSVTANGRTWTRTTAMVAANIITVNTRAGVITLGANEDTDLQGLFDPADVSMSGVSGRPPWLEPGNNTVTLNMGGHTGWTYHIWWRGRYA